MLLKFGGVWVDVKILFVLMPAFLEACLLEACFLDLRPRGLLASWLLKFRGVWVDVKILFPN